MGNEMGMEESGVEESGREWRIAAGVEESGSSIYSGSAVVCQMEYVCGDKRDSLAEIFGRRTPKYGLLRRSDWRNIAKHVFDVDRGLQPCSCCVCCVASHQPAKAEIGCAKPHNTTY